MPALLKPLLLALALFNLRACSSQATPLACMSGLTTLEAVARCLRQFMLPEGSIPASQWEGRNVLLDADQAARVRRLVHGMLQQLHEQPQQPQPSMASVQSVPPPNTCCAALTTAGLTSDALKSLGLSLQAFVDRQLQQPYCVLLETELADGRFSKGWGYFITPAGAAASLAPSTTGRSISSAGSYQAALDPPQLDGLAAPSKRQLPLHIACPHPLFDGRDIDVQAVHLFKASGARSVVVAGHHRLASNRSSSCLPKYPASDPSHNDADFLNVVSYALLAFEKQEQQRQQRRQQLQLKDLWQQARVGQCCCSCNSAVGGAERLASNLSGSSGEEGESGDCCCPANSTTGGCSCCCEGASGDGRCCCCLGPTGLTAATSDYSSTACACCKQLHSTADTRESAAGVLSGRPAENQPFLHQRQHTVQQGSSCLPGHPPPFVFLQLHGKAPTSCSNVAVFASAGLPGGGGAAHNGTQAFCADQLYGPAGHAWPVQRVTKALHQVFQSWRVLNPAQDHCPLVAAANVFGRVVNGVSEEQACKSPATNLCPDAKHIAEQISTCCSWGTFVHLEQAAEAVAAESWPGWVRALQVAYAGDERARAI